jgi:hypothetical protein
VNWTICVFPSANRWLGSRARIHRPSGCWLFQVCAIIACMPITGCSTLGSVQGRSEEMNQIASSYSNASILYNILRAKEVEPINFVTLSAFTGHGQAGASLGFPNFIIGPGRTPAQNLFIFGSNSINFQESTDFNISVLDDPQSIAALSRPIDPATIGFLINQQHNRDILFFLIISRIDIVDTTKLPENRNIMSYLNEPYTINSPELQFGFDNTTFGKFYKLLVNYINEGLTVMVDQGFVPQGNTTGKARFCFDPAIPNPTTSKPQDVSVKHTSTCPSQAELNSATFPVDWSFPNPNNSAQRVQVYTRSVYGMYRYLGELARLRNDGLISKITETYDGGVFNSDPTNEMLVLNHNNDEDGCWTSVFYEKAWWCVPHEARNTKHVFNILHLLFRLYAQPGNQTVTPTVRAIGGS